MSTNIWASLVKSQDDATTIEEFINQKIAEHNNEVNAHNEPGQSLALHRENDIIDHPAGSIKNDKESFQNVLYRLFFSDLAYWQQRYGVQTYAQSELTLAGSGSEKKLGVYQPLTFVNDDLFTQDSNLHSYKMSIQMKSDNLTSSNSSFTGYVGVNCFPTSDTQANMLNGFQFGIDWLALKVNYNKYKNGVYQGVFNTYIGDFNLNVSTKWLEYTVYTYDETTDTETEETFPIAPFDFGKYNHFSIQYVVSEHAYYYYLNGYLISKVVNNEYTIYSNGVSIYNDLLFIDFVIGSDSYHTELYEGNQQQLGAYIFDTSANLNGKSIVLFDPYISMDATY